MVSLHWKFIRLIDLPFSSDQSQKMIIQEALKEQISKAYLMLWYVIRCKIFLTMIYDNQFNRVLLINETNGTNETYETYEKNEKTEQETETDQISEINYLK